MGSCFHVAQHACSLCFACESTEKCLASSFPAGENESGKYISQTTWDSKDAFINWTQSSQFSASHNEKDSKRPSVGTMLEGPPSPQMFSSVTVTE